ncbi:MAG TPA: undecaprenyl-phosphate glucose phosphotransferase [Kiloniellales bacterium]|nr:undecaprenyl-phosphate glucose phosphotransferase [Kiloniellales bacterium]
MVQLAPTATTGKETVLAGLLRIGDVLLVAGIGCLAFYLRFGTLVLPTVYLAAIFLGPLLAFNALSLGGGYDSERVRRPLRRFGRTLVAWLAAMAALALLSVVLKISDYYSRGWFLIWITLGGIALFLLRLGMGMLVAHWRGTGDALMRVALIGAGPRARQVARQLAAGDDPMLRVVGHVWLDPPLDRGGGERMTLLGGIDELPEIVRRDRIEEAVVAVDAQNREALGKVLRALQRLPITVRFAMEPPSIELPARGVSELAGLPMLDLWRRPLSTWERLAKVLEDRVLAMLFLVLAAPLMLLIALAIKVDSRGPVLFRQRRAGFSNDTFKMLKFRTMTHGDAPPDLDDAEVLQARRNDTRVTRVGSFLRRSSLDELPQLLNVLRGEMSLVGPRPHAIQHDRLYAQLIDDYLARQRVKPGMTGWAQVNGLRGETDTPEKMRRRVVYDLYYIDNWSVWLDLKILFLTIFVGFVHKNAY